MMMGSFMYMYFEWMIASINAAGWIICTHLWKKEKGASTRFGCEYKNLDLQQQKSLWIPPIKVWDLRIAFNGKAD